MEQNKTVGCFVYYCWGLDLREFIGRLICPSGTSSNPSAGPRRSGNEHARCATLAREGAWGQKIYLRVAEGDGRIAQELKPGIRAPEEAGEHTFGTPKEVACRPEAQARWTGPAKSQGAHLRERG